MTKRLWPILTGFTLWSLAFIALYGLQYLGCHLGWPPGPHRAALLGGYVIALLLLAGYLTLQITSLRKRPVAATAVENIGIGTTIAALAATAVTLGPVAFASLCI